MSTASNWCLPLFKKKSYIDGNGRRLKYSVTESEYLTCYRGSDQTPTTTETAMLPYGFFNIF